MEPPKRRPLDVSGIPRLSRLPVPRGVSSSLPRKASSQPSDEASIRSAKLDVVSPQKSPSKWLETTREHGEVKILSADLEDGVGDKHALLQTQPSRRRSRPSLSDRTMDTLAQIPPSPSPRKRRSSLFRKDGPTTSPLRPSSSMARSRPSTSLEIYPPVPDIPLRLRSSSPEKRPLVPIAGKSPSRTIPPNSNVVSPTTRSMLRPRLGPNDTTEGTPSRSKLPYTDLRSHDHKSIVGAANKTEASSSVTGSKTLGARPAKSRPSAQAFFGVLSKTDHDQRTPVGRTNLSQVSAKESASPVHPSSKLSTSSKRPSKKTIETAPSPKTPPQKSSASLREAIAKAKAERQAAIKAQSNHKSGVPSPQKNFEDADLASSNRGLLKKRIQMARTDGRLNIAAMGLSTIPAEVMNMYDIPASGSNEGEWYESVDLVRLVAADNEITSLEDAVFPDDDMCSVSELDGDFKGNMFGGLETLDLHGNRLCIVPRGIRRLHYLTSLNFSKNKLDNRSLVVFSQVQSLRELRLTGNDFEGILDPCITELQHLEILDLSNNRVSALPDNIGVLSNLHTLSLANNRITSLPSTLLASTALAILDVSRNRLTASLLIDGVTLPSLKTLDVSNNALTSIVDGVAFMPNLQTLNVAENRLEILPDLSGSTNLIVLTAAGNKIAAVPESLVGLRHLKNLDLSQNNLRKIDERFGFIESLNVLRLANNPLRDRKLLSLGTEDLKSELRARLLSAQNDAEEFHIHSSTEDASGQGNPAASSGWPVKPGGVLDRSSTGLATLEAHDVQRLINENEIKILKIQHNKFTQIPSSVALLTSTLVSFNISNNKLSALTYLASKISLPSLISLDMSQNSISSFTPLFEHLDAPKLSELNVSRNRVNSLPPLHIVFPMLRSVLAADNCIVDLTVESVQGLKVLDVSGNEIQHLDPKLGLLEDDGLQTLLVGANRFRVPRRDIIDKGTGAILAWLRGRVPEGEGVGTVHTRIEI